MSATTVARVLCSVAEAYGVSLDDVLERHGVSRRLLEDPEARVSGQLDMDLFDELSARAGEPALGIRMAMVPAPLNFDLVDYVARNSPDLASAYRNMRGTSGRARDRLQSRARRHLARRKGTR